MPEARLEVADALGRRVVPIAKAPFEIGRRETNDLRLAGSEVSRDHAEIARDQNGYVLRDRTSRYGTYVNGEQVTERTLVHGDRIRLGRSGGAEMVFLLAESDAAPRAQAPRPRRSATCARSRAARGTARARQRPRAGRRAGAGAGFGDRGERRRARLHHAGVGRRRARVQDGARPRARRRCPAAASRPAGRFPTKCSAPASRGWSRTCSTASSRTSTWAPSRSGIRNVLCVPLRLVRYLDKAEAVAEERRIGVLYLDSREKGRCSRTRRAPRSRRWRPKRRSRLRTRGSIARRWRRRGWSRRCGSRPRSSRRCCRRPAASGAFFRAAAASLPCRSIGGDFFDYVDLPTGALRLCARRRRRQGTAGGAPERDDAGDVRGAGGGERLAVADDRPRQHRALPARHRVAVRDADVRRAAAGRPPDLLQRRAQSAARHVRPAGRASVRRLEVRRADRRPVRRSRRSRRRRSTLAKGDWLIVFSDGVSEAMSADRRGVRRGAHRQAGARSNLALDPRRLLEALFADVREFTRGAAQSDDITAMVLRYGGGSLRGLRVARSRRSAAWQRRGRSSASRSGTRCSR